MVSRVVPTAHLLDGFHVQISTEGLLVGIFNLVTLVCSENEHMTASAYLFF